MRLFLLSLVTATLPLLAPADPYLVQIEAPMKIGNSAQESYERLIEIYQHVEKLNKRGRIRDAGVVAGSGDFFFILEADTAEAAGKIVLSLPFIDKLDANITPALKLEDAIATYRRLAERASNEERAVKIKI